MFCLYRFDRQLQLHFVLIIWNSVCIRSFDTKFRQLVSEFLYLENCSNGNDFESLSSTLEKAKNELFNGFPVINIMKTVMGKGVDFMENSHKWHGIAPNDEQLKIALSQLEETLGDF